MRLLAKGLGQQQWKNVLLCAIVVVKMEHVSFNPGIVRVSGVVQQRGGATPNALFASEKGMCEEKRDASVSSSQRACAVEEKQLNTAISKAYQCTCCRRIFRAAPVCFALRVAAKNTHKSEIVEHKLQRSAAPPTIPPPRASRTAARTVVAKGAACRPRP